MSREWKPGDVAIVRVSSDYPPEVAVRGANQWYVVAGPRLGSRHGWCEAEVIRPLVVIDPDDREQVERLVDEFRSLSGWASSVKRESANAMQAALREFANPTPPKPAEPTGLGAVVEDADGKRWVRVLKAPAFAPWAPEGQIGLHSSWRTYADIAAVRVLSEGVTA